MQDLAEAKCARIVSHTRDVVFQNVHTLKNNQTDVQAKWRWSENILCKIKEAKLGNEILIVSHDCYAKL